MRIGTGQEILYALVKLFQAPFEPRESVEQGARHALRAGNCRLRLFSRLLCCMEAPSTILVSLRGVEPRGSYKLEIIKLLSELLQASL